MLRGKSRLPGVVATQMNANDAIRAAYERINHLTRLKSKKTANLTFKVKY